MGRRRLLTAATVVVLAAGGCGDGGGSDAAQPTPAASASTAGDAAACSAAGLSVSEQPDLPDAVAETRRAVAEAAAACDYDELARLAADDQFTYSFGGGEDPGAFWREEESNGGEPLRFLVELLERPYATVETPDAPTQHVWPSAFSYASWSDVPSDDREALRPLYGDEDFDGFESFGGYVGYRVGIEADGTWRFFVVGD